MLLSITLIEPINFSTTEFSKHWQLPECLELLITVYSTLPSCQCLCPALSIHARSLSFLALKVSSFCLCYKKRTQFFKAFSLLVIAIELMMRALHLKMRAFYSHPQFEVSITSFSQRAPFSIILSLRGLSELVVGLDFSLC